ncbi:MAG: hypothetical protein BGO29_14495 [Bacteroidales bacterium 36-12]|nr:MAG: hypothetical protein BGO29_14495 [Bacteroidales bacterium 36-12]
MIIFIGGLFRVLWFFWLVGLIPLAKNKRQLFFYSTLLSLGVISSLIVHKLFVEFVPNYSSSLVESLKNGEVKNVIFSTLRHFVKNVINYFFSKQNGIVYIFMKFSTAGAVMFFTILALKYKSKLNIALALIGLTNFLLLFILYDAFDWREIRTMSPLFYFYILFIVLEVECFIKYINVFVLIVIFALNIKTSKQWIAERNIIDLSIVNKERMAYNEISKVIPNNKVILLDYIPKDYTWELLNLPLQNINNHQIRYIIKYYDVGKTHYDYILKRPTIDTTSKKIIDNEYYVLVKNE